MSKKIQELTEQLKAVLGAARDIAATVEGEGRDFSDDERTTVAAKMKEAGDLKGKLEKAKADKALLAAVASLGDDIGLSTKTDTVTPSGLHVPAGSLSLGEHFTGSAEYKTLLETVPGGHFTKDHRVVSRPVGYKNLLASRRGQKGLITGASTSAGNWSSTTTLGFRSPPGIPASADPARPGHPRHHRERHRRVRACHRLHQRRRARG